MLQRARHLKTELQKGTRQRTAMQRRQKKESEGRRSLDNPHVAWKKNWRVMNIHIDG
jgi:hypothetical protein